MPWRTILLWLGFQAVWFACALGAARGTNAPGLIAGLSFTAIAIATSKQRVPEASIAALSGLAGLVLESALLRAGFVTFAAPWPSEAFAPAWIVVLWLAFGSTLSPLASALGRNRPLAAALGAVAGPLAYLAGERLGALQLPAALPLTILALAAVWAAALPALLAIYDRLAARTCDLPSHPGR